MRQRRYVGCLTLCEEVLADFQANRGSSANLPRACGRFLLSGYAGTTG